MLTLPTRKQYVSILTVLITTAASAQTFDLTGGIEEATQEVSGLIPVLRNFLWILSALVALYGSYAIYQKFQNQERDTNKAIATWAGAFIFLFVAGFVINSAFGL